MSNLLLITLTAEGSANDVNDLIKNISSADGNFDLDAMKYLTKCEASLQYLPNHTKILSYNLNEGIRALLFDSKGWIERNFDDEYIIFYCLSANFPSIKFHVYIDDYLVSTKCMLFTNGRMSHSYDESSENYMIGDYEDYEVDSNEIRNHLYDSILNDNGLNYTEKIYRGLSDIPHLFDDYIFPEFFPSRTINFVNSFSTNKNPIDVLFCNFFMIHLAMNQGSKIKENGNTSDQTPNYKLVNEKEILKKLISNYE